MLLLVKKRFADAIRSGEKTIEIRAGKRYRNIRAGSCVSINGHFRRDVAEVEHAGNNESLVTLLAGRFHLAGFTDESDARAAIRDCYPVTPDGGFHLIHLADRQ